MPSRRILVITLLGLTLLAGGLRFLRLGDWPFSGDELPTIQEAHNLFEGGASDLHSQSQRLPRLIPLSYAIHQLGYQLFGQDEGGSRFIIAILGVMNVLLVYYFLESSVGRVPALATALLIALWPEHIYRSQENRFYIIAALGSSLTMLLGARTVQRQSHVWTALAGCAGVATILTHTLQGLALLGLAMAIFGAAILGRNTRLMRLLFPVGVAWAAAAALAVIYVLPLAQGWNSNESWGYGLGHSVMALISQLGWPIALLTALGGVAALRRGGEQEGYWLAWAALWLAAGVVLPRFVSYHPGYLFPLSLGALVLAGYAIGLIYEGLRMHSPVAAYAWIGVACVLNFPSLASHYCDGSRLDFRSAARQVKEGWQPGDRVATTSASLLKHYTGPGIEPIPISASNPVSSLQRLTKEPGRLWIVLPSTRGGVPEPTRKWLGIHCSQLLRACKKRFDYYENATEVYLYGTPENEPAWAQGD